MGATHVCTILKWPVNADGEAIPESDELYDAVSQRFVEKLLEAGSDDPMFDHLGEDCLRDWQENAVAEVDVILSMFRQPGLRPDCSVIIVGDGEYLVTGGMTWGDEPTDAFGPMLHLAMLDVTAESFAISGPTH